MHEVAAEFSQRHFVCQRTLAGSLGTGIVHDYIGVLGVQVSVRPCSGDQHAQAVTNRLGRSQGKSRLPCRQGYSGNGPRSGYSGYSTS